VKRAISFIAFLALPALIAAGATTAEAAVQSKPRVSVTYPTKGHVNRVASW